MPSTITYTRTAKILHWLIALAIIGMIIMGWSFDYLPKGETKFALMQFHKSIGITILVLSLFRLSWRLMHRAPALPATAPRWEQKAAPVGHALLYAAMIGMPLSGWLMVSTSTYHIPTILYGLVTLPNLPVADAYRSMANTVGYRGHGLGGYATAALVAGHIAAALRHHFILRDDILLRMAPKGWAGFLNRWRGSA